MTESRPVDEIWVLGATGRVGRSVAARLAEQGVAAVLVGRRRESLAALQAELGQGNASILVADGVNATAAAIEQRRPAVVVNLIGQYAETAPHAGSSCAAGRSLPRPGGRPQGRFPAARSARGGIRCGQHASHRGWIRRAGYGSRGGDDVCRPPAPSRVRVDALSSVATEPGVLGTAFASSIIEAITNGGLQYQNGQLVKIRLGADPQTLTLPDGETVKSAGAATGELLAAQQASGAPSVTVTSALAPTGALVRAILPLAGTLLSIPALRRLAVRRMAQITMKAALRPRRHSWGHAVLTWPDGTVREGWLRADDGMDYTVAAEVAVRLARGGGKPGAHTPAAAFGPDLAVSAGGTFLLD